ncbi:RNA polymerase sigma factor SigE, partial [Mycobacterium sp. ITM-2017-0098]
MSASAAAPVSSPVSSPVSMAHLEQFTDAEWVEPTD